ncbi:MAG: L-threonylcarbamoyladenylate synthase [Nitrospinaceae bacterium]
MPTTKKVDVNDALSLRDHLETIKGVLDAGGVIAFPTDTFYGLGANPFNEKAIDKIFRIKERHDDKPLLVLVASLSQAASLCARISPEAKFLIDHFWPGPLTLLFDASPEVPERLTAGTGKVGVRLPGNELARKLIEEIGIPLTAPSANISGGDSPRSAAEVETSLGGGVDLILDGGPAPGGLASTLLDTTVSPPKIIREGPVTVSQIEAVLKTHRLPAL